MNVIVKPLSEIHEAAQNVRRHTDKQLKEYVRSLKMFGQIKPIVIDEAGEILAGNGLYLALKQMQAESCECVVMAGLSEQQKKKLMLADNRVYELGITDMDAFEEIVQSLEGDIDIPGWDEDLLEMLNTSAQEMDSIVSSYGAFQEEDVARLNERSARPEPAAIAPPVQAPTPTIAENDAVRPIAASTSAPMQGSAEPESREAAEPMQQCYIICPKCGEKICL